MNILTTIPHGYIISITITRLIETGFALLVVWCYKEFDERYMFRLI